MKKFKPYAWFNPYGEHVEFWAEDSGAFTEWCNPFFDVHRDSETHEPIGFIVHWGPLKKKLAEGFVLDVVEKKRPNT